MLRRRRAGAIPWTLGDAAGALGGHVAGLGFLLASRVFASHEAMYQSMLASGARVPETKPAMEPGDRGPAVAVGIAATVIALFIVYLFVRLG